MPDPHVQTPRLPTIQALRGVAAALIVALHALHEAGLAKPGFPLKMGVDLFFVISGFIMVYTSRALFARPRAWREFAARRLVRIVPIYWFYTSLLVVAALVLPGALQTASLEPLHLLLSYAFIPHPGPGGSLHPFLEVGWTLNYEMCFYAAFAVLLFLPARRMLVALTLVFGAAVLLGTQLPVATGALHFWTRPIVLGFVGGAWLGQAYVSGMRLPGPAAWGIPVLAVALLSFGGVPVALRPWIIQASAIALVALAILPAGMVGRRVPPVFNGLGDASYSIYLSHPFILGAAALLLRDLPPWSRGVVGGVSALAGGYLLYRLVERPLIAMTRRALSRGRAECTHDESARPVLFTDIGSRV